MTASGADPEASPFPPGLGRVLVVNLYYPPDIASSGHLLADLCEGLAARGVDVTVVCGQPSYTEGSGDAPAHENLRGVSVHRVSVGRAKGRERVRTRLTGYFRFMWGAYRRALALAAQSPPDVVVTFSNPPVVGALGARVARKSGARFVYVLYDIHPDAVVATGYVRLPRPVVWLWDRVGRWILRRADAVVVPGDAMAANLIEQKGTPPDRVNVIPNWGRPELSPGPQDAEIRRELNMSEGELLLLYSGNMGIMHPLEWILDAVPGVADLPVRFLLVGDGAKREPMTRRAEQEGLSNVSFLPFQPETRFRSLVAAADACFVPLMPGLERCAVPSRAYTFLSAGKPILSLMSPEADIARLVADSRCGWNAVSGEDLARVIRTLAEDPELLVEAGRRGRAVYEETFARQRILDRYFSLLADHAAGGSAS